jgi:membrane-bound lytic murein transglycosylase D
VVEGTRVGWWPVVVVAPLLAVIAAASPASNDEAVATGSELVDTRSVGIPLEVNPRVERWLEAFQTTRREEFEGLLLRREIYSEMILTKLRDRGMPEELLYIPMIESGLSPFAVSRVSAVGLWQFMGPTAQQYGLRVDPWVDERRDPVAATDAALDYLAWLHHRFGGSWTLAAAAYNAGPGRVERVLNRHAEGWLGDEDLFWDVVEHLPRETREYVPKMIAVTRLANTADALGFDSSGVEPYRYENVFVPGGTSLEHVARELGVGANALRVLNPHLVRGVTPPDEIFALRVPVGNSATLVDGMSDRGMARLADDD